MDYPALRGGDNLNRLEFAALGVSVHSANKSRPKGLTFLGALLFHNPV